VPIRELRDVTRLPPIPVMTAKLEVQVALEASAVMVIRQAMAAKWI
jgi:hypothetical protein